MQTGRDNQGGGLPGAGKQEGRKRGGRKRGRGGENAVLEGEAEVGIGEGDMALVVREDEGAFHQEDGGEFAFLEMGVGRGSMWEGGVRCGGKNGQKKGEEAE